MGGHQRRGEVQRRHGGKRISSEDIVKGAPAVSPELLAVLDHHPPHVERLAVVEATLSRPPTTAARSGSPSRTRRRGRTRAYIRAAAAGNRSGRAHEHVGDARVGHEEPHPVAPHEHALEAVDLARASSSALQAQRRRHAEAEHPVDRDRVVDAHPRLEPLGVVVGHLVGGQVGPHVQRADAGVAQPRPRGTATHSAAGRERRRRPAPTAGGSLTRRRRTGSATPAATRAQAAALMALDARKARRVYGVPASAEARRL